MILGEEGCLPCHHLVECHANRPHIHELVVPSTQQHFRRQILRSPNDCQHVSSRSPLKGLLGDPKINNFDSFSLHVEEDVVRLDVAMADVAFVDVRDDFEEFRENKLEVLDRGRSTGSGASANWVRLGKGKCSMTR